MQRLTETQQLLIPLGMAKVRVVVKRYIRGTLDLTSQGRTVAN